MLSGGGGIIIFLQVKTEEKSSCEYEDHVFVSCSPILMNAHESS